MHVCMYLTHPVPKLETVLVFTDSTFQAFGAATTKKRAANAAAAKG